jgi:hypothetical protein
MWRCSVLHKDPRKPSIVVMGIWKEVLFQPVNISASIDVLLENDEWRFVIRTDCAPNHDGKSREFGLWVQNGIGVYPRSTPGPTIVISIAESTFITEYQRERPE